MSLLIILRLALEALRRNPLRSALTALGIIIGVAAVILMVALGSGARSSIADRVQALGANVVTVSAGSARAGGVRLGQGATTTLTAADAEALRAIDGVRAVSPGVNVRGQVVARTGNWQTTIQGAGQEMPAVRAWTVDIGGFFDATDVARAAKVAVIGAVVRDQLFGANADPTGATVRIMNTPFTVIGVLGRKGQSPMGQDQDDTVVIPFTTAQRRLLGSTHLANVTVSVADDVSMAEVSDEIASLLRLRHRLATDAEDDFTVRSAEEMASVLTSTTNTMTYLLASVAAVSLLVGGIGIMNIMLVSVTERTREVGLRRSLGARRRDILRQFLVEALVLGVAGGLVGVALGVAAASGLTAMLHWATRISPAAIGIAFGFAAAIGAFFGWYPARRAAALAPTEALRYE